MAKAAPPRGLPPDAVPVRAFVISGQLGGKSGRSVYLPNGVSTPQSLQIDWGQPSVASIGLELQVKDGAPQTQSIDGPESAWSLFRLLERAQLDGKTATFRLPGGSGGSSVELSFTFNVEPFSLFQASRGTE